jgi:hypothetical protein
MLKSFRQSSFTNFPSVSLSIDLDKRDVDARILARHKELNQKDKESRQMAEQLASKIDKLKEQDLLL